MKKKRLVSRRFLVFTMMVAGTAFALGTVLSQTIPKAKSWMLVTIDQFSRDHLPVRILPGSVDFRIIPLGVTLNDVRILPSKDFESILSPLTIQELSVDLSLWQVIRGEVSLDEVAIRGTEVRVTIPEPKTKGGKPLEGLFKELDRAPVGSIILSEVSAVVEIPHQSMIVEVEHLNLDVERSRAKLEATVNAESLVLKDLKGKRALRLTPEAEITMTPKTIDIDRLEIRRGNSLITVAGRLDGDTEGLEFNTGKLNSELDLDVKSTRDWVQKSFADAEPTPPMEGRLKSSIEMQKKAGEPWTAGFKLSTTGYRVEGILVDNIQSEGSWDGKQLTIPKAVSQSRAGGLEITDLKVGEGAEKTAEGRTPWLMRIGKIKGGVELHEFLADMGVGPIPVWLSAQGEFPCESQLVPKFVLRCGGTFHGQNVVVQGDLKNGRVAKKSIVAIPTFTAKGDFAFDLDKFSYNAEIQMPNSTGRSSGEVRYLSGFDIKYEADKLAIKDLASLGDLKLAGNLKLKGTTSGGSAAAWLTMDAEGQDLWLEDFWLGQPKGQVSYKAGKLSFNSMQGYYTTSRYSGDVVLNLKTPATIDTTIKVPFFDARDLLKVFSKKFTLPIVLTGTGQAAIKASGPLDISRMTYDLKSSLFKGTVAGENFDQMHFDVKSKAGEVKSERVMLTRGDAVIQLNGVGHPNGKIETEVRGRGLRLEETNFISDSGFALTGVVGFDMTMNGPVLAPDAEMKGTLTRTSIAETSMPDSQFSMRFMAKTVEGRGQFLGDLLKGEFVWPLTADAPMSLQFQSNEWNYAPVFAAFAGPSGRRDFEGRLTAKVDLKSARGGFWAANGSATIDKLSLRRGGIELLNERPMRAEAKDGTISVRDFELKGDGTFIKIADRTGADAPARKVDIQINSKIDMNLLSIFTPFFEELRGLLSMAISLKLGPEGSDVIGSAYIDRAFLKFPQFGHAFENLQSDIVFNHRKVVINTLKSDFAGGKIQAVGGLEFQGRHKVPVNVNGTFEKITLNIPEKIRTSGSGDFTFTGSWFPFLLKGNYNIRDGLMTKELGEGGAGPVADESLRRDQFLPRFLAEEAFQPLMLDLNVDFSNGIQLKNEMIEGSAAGKLQVTGAPTKPSIAGQIRTQNETKIKFRENIFDVSTALLSFEDPLEINPRINLNARTRVDSYDVNLLVQGTPKKPEITLTSIPPLPERDLYSLLALGTTDQKLSTNVKSGDQGSGAGAQVLSGVANQALKGVTKKLDVDVQLSSGFDSSDESYQKVVIKKQFNRKLEVSGSQSFGKNSEKEAKLRYRMTDRVSGVVSWQGVERGETSSDSLTQQVRSQNKVGLDFEYKFEFK